MNDERRLPTRVAAIVPAKDEGDSISATVAAIRTIPEVDLVVVVDDGSSDSTAGLAQAAGALVVRHDTNHGKGAALESGAAAVAQHEARERLGRSSETPLDPPRALLFVDADLKETAAETRPLIAPVLDGVVDMTVAVLPPQGAGGGRGRVVRVARSGIEKATGWAPLQPLSGMRCLRREAFDVAMPLAEGWGVETGMTIDVMTAGLTVAEVPCDLQHRVSPATVKGMLHRARQMRDVLLALHERGMLRDAKDRTRKQ